MDCPEVIPTFPYYALIEPTFRCNLHCPFCLQRGERGANCSELAFERWLSLIDEMSQMQLLTVTVSGGEPFFYPHIRPLLERIVQGKMRFKLISNGTLLDQKTVDFIASLRRCDSVQISLDGMPKEHDAIRGKGSFQKARRAIEMLAAAGIPVITNTVITRNNFRNVLSLAKEWEKLPLRTYRFTPIGAQGKVTPDLLRPQELADVMAQLELHSEELPHFFRGNLLAAWVREIRAPHPGDPDCVRCAASYAEVGVHPDGSVTPCVDYFGMSVGNIRDKSLREIWNDLPYREFRARVKAGARRDAPRCTDCPYRFYCRKFCYFRLGEYYCRKVLAELLEKRGVKL